MEAANLGPLLQPGDVCAQGGAYEVTHNAHRGPHTVMVRKGEIFPRCNGCGDAVRFQLISAMDEDKTSEDKTSENQASEDQASDDQASPDAKRKRAGQGS